MYSLLSSYGPCVWIKLDWIDWIGLLHSQMQLTNTEHRKGKRGEKHNPIGRLMSINWLSSWITQKLTTMTLMITSKQAAKSHIITYWPDGHLSFWNIGHVDSSYWRLVLHIRQNNNFNNWQLCFSTFSVKQNPLQQFWLLTEPTFFFGGGILSLTRRAEIRGRSKA